MKASGMKDVSWVVLNAPVGVEGLPQHNRTSHVSPCAARLDVGDSDLMGRNEDLERRVAVDLVLAL